MTPDWRRIEIEQRGLRVESASFLGEGWNSSAFVVNRKLVFRFPKRAEVWDEIEREIAFLAWSAERLPLDVPRYRHVARRSPAAPHGYAAYRYLPGRALDIAGLSNARRSDAADRLAAFLRALHDLNPPHELRALLPCEDERAVAAEYRARAEREIAPRLEAREVRELSRQFDASVAARPTAVVHADLSAEHVLMENSAVAGILDFGDVNLGDPDYDFTYLCLDFGWPFAAEVARRYGHPDLDRLSRKVRFFALVDQIDTIVNGDGLAREDQVARAWTRLGEYLR